ncbi:MAG: site-specific integrase [Tepidisphaeraceae bacterium]
MTETTIKRAETQRFAFTKERLSRLTVPSGKAEAWVFDRKSPWLGYRLTAGGVGAFYVFRRIKGIPAKVRLGGQEITIEQARALADEVNVLIAKGIDPREQRRQDRANSATLGDLVEHFIETHSKPHKKTWADDEAMVKLYLADWTPRRLSSITGEDFRALHAKVGAENGKYSANRLLSLLHAAYARPGDLWQGGNPVHGIAKFREKSRDRFLTAAELPRFFAALADEENETIRDYLLVLLLAGARRSNTAAMRWDELDLDRGLWRIPMTKTGQPLLVPLAPQVIQILERRKESSISPWVFPTASNTKRSKSGHVEQFRHAWKAILKRAGIADFRLHDLRRTLGSWMTMSGSSLPLVGRALGHKNQNTTAIYARLAVDPVRIGVDTAVASMMAKALPAPKKKTGAK